MVDAMRSEPRLITVFGGSGFLGRHVVRALAKRGHRIRVAVRRPDLAYFLQPLGSVGQIHAVQANLRYRGSIERAVDGADGVVNLVGILQESGRQSFAAIQAEGAEAIARAAGQAGGFVQVSALGADARSDSDYAQSKAAGEAAVLAAQPGAVILRPSVMFGQGDTFFNRFASLGRTLPVLPIVGAETRFQPVFVGDVAEAVCLGLEGKAAAGAVYELGGPEVKTLRELVEYVLAVTGRRRPIAALPASVAGMQAFVLEILTKASLGLLPESFRLTRDQVRQLAHDNVVSEEARRTGRTLQGLGIMPESIGGIVPDYLVRFRRSGQFNIGHA